MATLPLPPPKQDRRNASIAVEKCIEVREGFLYLLMELSERVAPPSVPLDDRVRREVAEFNRVIDARGIQRQ